MPVAVDTQKLEHLFESRAKDLITKVSIDRIISYTILYLLNIFHTQLTINSMKILNTIMLGDLTILYKLFDVQGDSIIIQCHR